MRHLSNFTNFHIFKNTIKQIAFENAYETSVFFKSLFYMSSFLQNLRLLRPFHSVYAIKNLVCYKEFYNPLLN